MASEDRDDLVRRGLWLEWFTVAYNTAEGVCAVAAGLLAGSVALTGFGLDSAIEVTSGAALLWRLNSDAAVDRHRREKTALRVVGASFLALAAYVAFEAIESLVRRELPERTVFGIAVATASLIIMPFLARAKRRIAARIDSVALTADSRQTDLCAYLSAVLLGGLVLNWMLGWWWADPVAALVMVPIIAKEGLSALSGRDSCECH
jgi:divalent metal cation (Fe/Co/Zn/Cd) transporter